MKKLILCSLFGFSCALMIAQTCGQSGAIPSQTGSVIGSVGTSANINPGLSHISNFMSDINAGKYSASLMGYDEIKGSPYLIKENVEGTLVLNNGQKIENVSLNYDLYIKEVIAENEDGETIVLDTKYYQEVIMPVDGEMKHFKKVNPKRPHKFFEVLYESGEVAFFKDQKATLRTGQNLGITEQPSQFNQSSRYYVSGEDNSVAKVNLKKRDVFDHFPEMEAVVMREYIKNSKIKLSKEKDYKALFAALDD